MHVYQGRQHCQVRGDGLGMGPDATPESPPCPLSPWYIYQQVSIGIGQWDPRGDWMWSNSLIPLQTPVDNSSPRCDVTWYSQHIDPWQEWEPWLSRWLAKHHSILCLDRGSQSGKSGLWGQRHYWLIIRAWNGTLVHLVKVALPNSNLICCLNIPLFLSTSTAVCSL